VTVTRSDGGSFEEFEASIEKKVSQANLICFDDVGVRQPSDAQREIFNHFIDLRLDKPTIINTNLDHRQFAEVFDMRTTSRVFSGTIIRFSGKDRRFQGVEVKKV
jgi:DNA replication protein DnaC